MKQLLIIIITSLLFSFSSTAQSITKKGYPEHFAAGAIIGGAGSYFTYKKTNNKWKAWAFGFVAATGMGLLKEIADPSIGRTRSWKDFQYTVLGGAVGASIVIPLNGKKE